MFVNNALKRVADFHGHVCPELAIGAKFCEFVQQLQTENTVAADRFSILAENSTSALDAIQILLGVTVGNQRLMVMDYGKHNYALYCRGTGQSWSFTMRAMTYGNEAGYQRLEEKIINNDATLDDIIAFQRLIDERVRRILSRAPRELFVLEPTEGTRQQPPESTSRYTTCTLCGQQVLASRCITRRGEILCLPCLQKKAPGCLYHGIQ
ncbi:MAG: FmdE family protein [Desulfopila sp.]